MLQFPLNQEQKGELQQMGDARDRKSAVLRLLRERKIANLEELKSVLGTNVRIPHLAAA